MLTTCKTTLLGLGTNRLPIASCNDISGIDMSVEIILRALNLGIRYIDTAPTYSRGMAHSVLKLVFEQTKNAFDVTLKSSYASIKTADDVRRHADRSLQNMGINHATYFLAWSIMNYEEFEQIMKPGSLYDGAQKLKAEGIVDHICFSTHAPVADIIKIIKSSVFEEVTISYSLLNGIVVRPVLDCALAHNVGVVVMNPLGGGVIPENRGYFSFACNSVEQNTVFAALRYVSAHPAVKTILSGISSLDHLMENMEAFDGDPEPHNKRIERVNLEMRRLEGFCTGCGYCSECPKNIPVSSIMQCRNSLLFKPSKQYNREDNELLRNIQLFKKMNLDFSFVPETPYNPCIKCGLCEKKCTQQLHIIDALEDTYFRMQNTSYSLCDRKKRLDALLNSKGYKKIGFFPSGGYYDKVMSFYQQEFGEPDFEVFLFNSNPLQWGNVHNGILVNSPDEIAKIMPDCILVCNFNYSQEIYKTLDKYTAQGIHVVKLHDQNDVPWVF